MKYCLSLLFFIAFNIHAQSVENINATAIGDEVELTYSLISEESLGYNISIYVAINDSKEYNQQIKLIEGDLKDVYPGERKKIMWRAKEEMGDFSGKVQFKIVAKKLFLSRSKKLECAKVELKRINQFEDKLVINASITSNFNGWIMLKDTEVKLIDDKNVTYKNPSILVDKSNVNKLIAIEANENINADITFKNISNKIQNISSFEFYVQSDGYCTARFNSNSENAYFKFSNLVVD